ncbi:MAG: InlB B-repeat-containing protein, partial [Clostridia bacterium]|nr:InlB B-repeat-containing protein [Clostridia bacterium]
MKHDLLKTTKKLLCALLSVLILSGAWMIALPAVVSATLSKSSAAPTCTFYVPETIYLLPSDNKTFQYYVDRDSSGTLSTSNAKTSGTIYFNCSGATKVKSITCTGASVTLSASSANSATLNSTISSGSLSDAISINGTTTITWTVTFTYGGTDYSATAYSVCYAPNRNVTAMGLTGYDYNSKESHASGIIYIQGAQTTNTAAVSYQDSSSDHRYNYQRVSGSEKYLDPLVQGIADPKSNGNNPHDYGNSSSSTFTGATKSYSSCYCVSKDNYDGDGDWVLHIDCNRTPAEIVADTSRYTNTNQIPNLKLGFIVTDLENTDKRRNWYVSDATSTVTNPNTSNPSLSFTWNYDGSNSTVDLLKHSRWRKDDFSKKAYGEGGYGVGTVLASSGSGSSTSGDSARQNNRYSNSISYELSGGSCTRYYRYGICGAKSSSWAMSTGFVLLKVTTVNKSSLRTLVNTCVGTYISPYYTLSTTYNTYLKNAYTVLGNPQATASEITTAYNNLNGSKPSINTGTATATHNSSTGKVLATETKTYNYGETVTAAKNTYTGYSYTSVSPTTLSYTNVTSATLSWTFTYTPINYTISYNLNGGSVATANKTSYNVETASFTLNNPTKTGYTFKGWSGTGLTGDTNTSVTVSTGSTGDRSYTANWTINKYTVTFKNGNTILQSGDWNYNTTPTYSGNTPTKASDDTNHYTFSGWNPAITAVTGAATYMAQFTTTAHSYGSWSTDTATCTAGGTHSRTCSVCNYTQTQSTPARGHDFSGAYHNVSSGTHNRKCTRCNTYGIGTTVNGTENCSGGTANCVDKAVCSKCSTAYGSVNASNHKTTENRDAVAATCTANGYTAGVYCTACSKWVSGHATVAALDHNWGEWTEGNETNHTRTCTRDSSHTDSAAHSWTEKVESKYLKSAATCEVTAVYYKSCSVCGRKGTATFTTGSALGHDYTGAAHDLGDGTHNRACKNGCGTYGTAEGGTQVKNGTVACTYGNWSADTATCENAGSQYRDCGVCGHRDTRATSALGHTWGAPTYTWANDNSTVTATRVCSRDGSHTETETVNTASVVKTPATCTVNGTNTYTGTFANSAFAAQTKDADDIPATGHAYGSWTKVDDNYHTRVCANDPAHVETVAHVWDSGTVIFDATPTENGTKRFVCTLCGATKDEEFEYEADYIDVSTVTPTVATGHGTFINDADYVSESDYAQIYKNLLYAEQGVASPKAGHNGILVDGDTGYQADKNIYYPTVVMLYDGITMPSFGIMFGMHGTEKPWNWNYNNMRAFDVSFSSGNDHLVFDSVYWHGSDVRLNNQWNWLAHVNDNQPWCTSTGPNTNQNWNGMNDQYLSNIVKYDYTGDLDASWLTITPNFAITSGWDKKNGTQYTTYSSPVYLLNYKKVLNKLGETDAFLSTFVEGDWTVASVNAFYTAVNNLAAFNPDGNHYYYANDPASAVQQAAADMDELIAAVDTARANLKHAVTFRYSDGRNVVVEVLHNVRAESPANTAETEEKVSAERHIVHGYRWSDYSAAQKNMTVREIASDTETIWNLTEDIAPTYSADGLRDYMCDHCGDHKAETVPKLKDLIVLDDVSVSQGFSAGGVYTIGDTRKTNTIGYSLAGLASTVSSAHPVAKASNAITGYGVDSLTLLNAVVTILSGNRIRVTPMTMTFNAPIEFYAVIEVTGTDNEKYDTPSVFSYEKISFKPTQLLYYEETEGGMTYTSAENANGYGVWWDDVDSGASSADAALGSAVDAGIGYSDDYADFVTYSGGS